VTPGMLLTLAALLFVIGVTGVLVRRNALVILMSVELMLNAANLTLLTFARVRGDNGAHVLAFMVIAVAASEAAVGLAIVIHLFRHFRSVNVDEVDQLKN
jgi:NADH-quinone oxidoreductase subunit K